MILSILLIISVIIYTVVLKHKKRLLSDLPLPPFPCTPFPLFGHAPFLSKTQPFKKIDEWSKKFGDIMTVKLGMDPVIVISRNRLLHETFVKQGKNFSGRPSLFVHESCWGRGLVIRDGEEAAKLRTFVLSSIRQRVIEEGESIQRLVSRETACLVDRLSSRIISSPSTSVSPIEEDLFFVVGNVLTQLAFGRRYAHGSKEFRDNASWLSTTNELMERTAMITFLPWLRWIPYFKYFDMKKKAAEVHKTMMDDIRGRRETGEYLDPSSNNLVAVFMRKVDEEVKRRQKEKEEGENLFTDEMLARIMTELFFAGIQTECNTFGWAFLYLAHNPEIQDKCRKEIWSNIGKDEDIEWNRRSSLPYLEAIIAETQRCANVAPFGLFHKNHEEAVLDGYRIPAGSIVMMNLYSTLTDPDVFKDPFTFSPDRFLNEKGNIDPIKIKASTPYGVGSRICMGENIARTELFTVIGTLIQHFRFSLIPGRSYSTQQTMELTIRPEKYELNIEFA